MSNIISEINIYKKEIQKLKQELQYEKESRFNFNGNQILLNQSREKENRIKIEIQDLENKINELEADSLYPLKSKLSQLENKLLDYEDKLNKTADEEEQIEYRFQIKVLKEKIEPLKEEIVNKTIEIEEQKRIEAEKEAERKRIEAEKEAERKRIEAERKRKDLLYKKLYVELTDDNLTTISQILRENNLFFSLYNKKLPKELSDVLLINDKHDYIKKLVNEFSEQEIWNLLGWEELFQQKIKSFLDEFDEEDILLLKRWNKDNSKDIIINFLKNNGENSKEKFKLKIKKEKERIEEEKRRKERIWKESKEYKLKRAKEIARKSENSEMKHIEKIMDDFNSNEILLLRKTLNISLGNKPEDILRYFLRRYGVNDTRTMIQNEINNYKKK